MISVVALWNQVQITAKSGTSGYQSDDEFNADLDTVQKRIANILCDNYDKSQKVEDALFGMIVSQTNDTDPNGVIAPPATYYRLISTWINVGVTDNAIPTPASKISSNQVSAYMTSYVRKPSVAANNFYYYYLDGNIQLLPATQQNYTLIYCQIPPAATVILTENTSDNSDYVVATSGTDLAWSPVVFNLFVYMMLEMLGIEMKDGILYEFSQLGIPKEAYLGMFAKGEAA